MNFDAKSVSPQAVKSLAEEYYRSGFMCGESVAAAVFKSFGVENGEQLTAMASGMGAGIGKSGCLCGALNGGVIALGLFFGRTVPGDPSGKKCMALCHELHNWFRAASAKNATCCRVLTKGFDMSKGEHKVQCVALTGLCAGKTAEIICRELGIENTDSEPIEGLKEPFRP